jgi:serine protease Do
MARIRSQQWVFIAIALIVILTGFYLVHRQSVNSVAEQVQRNISSLDLGIVYLPVTQSTAYYYELGVVSGALVTQVTKGSLVYQAGIKAGDVIISFNGVRVGEATPLLGLMRSCPAGGNITLEIWGNSGTKILTIMHLQ